MPSTTVQFRQLRNTILVSPRQATKPSTFAVLDLTKKGNVNPAYDRFQGTEQFPHQIGYHLKYTTCPQWILGSTLHTVQNKSHRIMWPCYAADSAQSISFGKMLSLCLSPPPSLPPSTPPVTIVNFRTYWLFFTMAKKDVIPLKAIPILYFLTLHSR